MIRLRARVPGGLLAAILAVACLAAEAEGQVIRPEKPRHPKLDGSLNRIAEAVEAGNRAAVVREERRGGLAVDGRLPVRIAANDAAAVAALLRAGGGDVANALGGILEAYIPSDLLLALAALDGVDRVSEIHRPMPLAISQGRALHNAVEWHSFGVMGAGVKVGIIDVGFTGYQALMGTELPATVVARCYTAIGAFSDNVANCATSNHGTAVAETLHDMAPAAQFYIANPISPLDLQQTVAWMLTQGVRVINHSAHRFWDGPGNGTSRHPDSPLNSVDMAVSGGAVFVNAAGNHAQASWFGSFADVDADTLLEFSPGIEMNRVQLTAGRTFLAQLRWSDTWGGAGRDLDLYLLDSSGTVVVAQAIEEQSGGPSHDPREILVYTPTVSGDYYLVVSLFSAPGNAPPWVQLQSFGQEPLLHFTAGSIVNPAESANPGMLAVGAAHHATPTVIAPYSSVGLTPDGRVKPDIVAAASADTETFGPGNFPGTSQAAPHVAGLAALVRQRFPALTPAQVASYLKSHASPRGAVPNHTWGFGFAVLPGYCTYVLSASSASHPFTAGGGSFTVTTSAGCSWTAVPSAAWLTVQIEAATGTVTYSVAANPGGQRTGTITVAGQTFTVTQAGAGPAMSLSVQALRFGATSTGGALAAKTGAQTVRIRQSGAGTVTWTATPSHPWLTVSPGSGTGPATLTINVQHHATLPVAGTTAGSIAFVFTGAGSSPGSLSVTLTTLSNGTSSSPTGSFDTPADGLTNITGSIALTGWALDDLEVAQIRVVRSPTVGSCVLPPGHSWIPVGTGTFVEGARPDVAGANPTVPRNSRAGWGYMMLSNFLPNLGNGTFTFCAVADDVEGRSAVIGQKTLTFDNANAVKPFGAIDTPGQGATAGGTVYNNFGWVLTPAPGRADPPSGGTVTVFINNQPVGSPTGWTSRPDLTALFPAASYPGIVNAAGVYTFNPQTFGEGVHTIAWSVSDSLGRTDGIGSRYFTVVGADGAATTSTSLAAPPMEPLPAALGAQPLADAVSRAPVSAHQLYARRGFDLSTPFAPVALDAAGRALVHAEELDRVEVLLGAEPGELTGYTRVGADLGPLPIGSHLDQARSSFGWQPGVGFVGRYELVFVRTLHGRVVARHEVGIVLHPRGSNRLGAQVMIDTPQAHLPLTGPFTIAGWALDLDDAVDTGVATVHVWAYPVEPGTGARLDPTFLGVAASGGARPDVAAVFGDRYLRSGYSLTVAGLEPATYDLAVFAWSTVRGGFVPATVVRVHVW